MDPQKSLFDKSKILFAVTWIVAYCVLFSVGDALSAAVGVLKAVTLPIGIFMSVILIAFLHKHNLFGEYGLCKPTASPREMLFYIPAVIMMSANLVFGVAINYNALNTVMYVLSMVCVGFLEEIIFRGLLFEAMRENGLKTAVIVSSVTFGIGHIINLINGSGAELLPNLLQVVYATAAGYMFVMMYYRSKSIIICIAAHGIFNALSIFTKEADVTDGMQIFTAMMLTAITGSYAVYLALSMKEKGDKSDG